MAEQSKAQKNTVGRVMHEFKHGELRIGGNGPKVKNPKQAIAIALHEGGATDQESPEKNRTNLRRSKEKERRGDTAQAAAEGKSHGSGTSRGSSKGLGSDKTRADLYAEAKRRDLPGRSKMNKDELERLFTPEVSRRAPA